MSKKNIILLVMSLLFVLPACAQKQSKDKEKTMDEKIVKPEDEWKKILTPMQFFVTREHGTERPFS